MVTNAIFIGVEVQDNLHNPNGDSLVLKARVSPSHLAVAGCGGGVCGAGDLGVQNSWNIPHPTSFYHLDPFEVVFVRLIMFLLENAGEPRWNKPSCLWAPAGLVAEHELDGL